MKDYLLALRVTQNGLFSTVLFFWLLLTSNIFQSVKINIASVNFLSDVIQINNGGESISDLPAYHPRAYLWQAIGLMKIGDYRFVITLLEPYISSEDLIVINIWGNAHEELGKYKEAIGAYKKIKNFDGLIRIAKTVEQSEQLRIAREAYYTAWKINPGDGTFALVDFLRKQKDYKAAEEVLLHSYDFNSSPYRRHLWWNRFMGVLDRQKDWSRAVELYRNAIENNPDEWEPYLGLGWAIYHLGYGTDAAISEFQKAIQIAPEIGDGYWATGKVLTREKKYAEADQWYLLAIERNPNQFDWYLTRGNSARIYDHSLALEIYQEAAKQFPEQHSRIFYEMAWNYKLCGQLDQAISMIEQAVSLETSNDTYYFRAGQIFEAAEQYEEALFAYEFALEINPNDIASQKAIQRISDESKK